MKPLKSLCFAALLVAFLIPAAAADHPTHEHPKKKALIKERPALPLDDGILAKAASDGRFTKFIAAVKAAGLTEKLQGEGPFTIFAPTDEAFSKLEKGTLADLMQPANQARLAGLLGNHVVPGKLSAEAVKTMKATNVGGRDLELKVAEDHWRVDGAKVIGEELQAGNGVIHAIDTVLMPPAPVEHSEKAAPKDHPGH